MSDQYYVRRAGKISGPAKAKLLEQYAANGKLQVTDEVATSPNGPWHAVSKVPLLANHLPATDELADPFGDPLAAASLLADGASVQPTSRPAKPQGRPSGKPSGGRAQRPGWLVPLLAGSGVVVVLLVAGAGFLLWRADESGLIGSWQGKESGPQGKLEILWTFNEDGTGNMGFGALAPSMPFTWESAGADRVTITLAAPNGQSQKTIATWAVSGDTLTFTSEGSPEKLVLKRASAQSAPRHPEYLAHTWKSHPVLSNGPKQTAVFAKTGVLTLTTGNGKPVQGTWEATGNQLTLSYPDTDSGELQTLVYQMTMGGADEEGTDTPISADLYLQGVGENKVSLMYTRPLHPEGQDGASTEEANPSGEPLHQQNGELERLRDDVIQKNIDTIGRANFPDNPNNTWAIRKTTHEGDLAYVEVIPSPQDVGYPSFIFVLDFKETTEGRFIGAYCMENGKYSLLFTESNLDRELPTER